VTPSTQPRVALATPAIMASCCVAAAAATPMIKLAGDDAIVGPEHHCPQPPDAVDKMVLRVQAKTIHEFLHHAGPLMQELIDLIIIPKCA
jgi:hypothetical protein